MPKMKKSKRRVNLGESINEKRRALKVENFPARLQRTLGAKTLTAVKALHRFKGRKMTWGKNKKGGAIQMVFKPVLGFETIARAEEELSKVQIRRHEFRADYMHGFKDWAGFAVRFMAYPTEAEVKKHTLLRRLDHYEWPRDFVLPARGAVGYVGGMVTFVGREKKPTLFIQAIEIRDEYFRITTGPSRERFAKHWGAKKVERMRADARAVKKRYTGWWKRWVTEVEGQCKRAGFERVAIVPSTDSYFHMRGVTVKPETRDSLYHKFPKATGYSLRNVTVPTTEGMKTVKYYCKSL
ncbi:MAG: hypothetical protein CL943_01490 [Candidatus Diapherotrites archaeon]|uniref:Uncharacterized protein n=1 Tax=Candidatus Iainarchaeum sp. TaxID=3101447 RepID=A0A2D6M0K4_9ARCH|nr:hypothetical protein [Candidatus Diapherotrites archaeon]|tara:strand:- start:4909 stop:5796 length:888 start_codon:yes stop_codon:yes gene_type:complete